MTEETIQLKYHILAGGYAGKDKRFNSFYQKRITNRGVTVVVYRRTKYADIRYDWDDEGTDLFKDLKIKHDANASKIESSIIDVAKKYVSEKNIKTLLSSGNILRIPIDRKSTLNNADKLATEICKIYTKHLK